MRSRVRPRLVVKTSLGLVTHHTELTQSVLHFEVLMLLCGVLLQTTPHIAQGITIDTHANDPSLIPRTPIVIRTSDKREYRRFLTLLVQ